MEYKLQDLEKDIACHVTRLRKMREAKGHDYSATKDTLQNLRTFGPYGVLVRIGDKFHRLASFFEKGHLKVKDEKVEDTMDDLINYALYLRIMWDQEKGTTSCQEETTS